MNAFDSKIVALRDEILAIKRFKERQALGLKVMGGSVALSFTLKNYGSAYVYSHSTNYAVIGLNPETAAPFISTEIAGLSGLTGTDRRIIFQQKTVTDSGGLSISIYAVGSDADTDNLTAGQSVNISFTLKINSTCAISPTVSYEGLTLQGDNY